MDSLSTITWDVLISGTGLQNSLLALALSRSNKKILHIDQNEYYGDAQAAFTLHEAEEWVNKIQSGSLRTCARNAVLWKAGNSNEKNKLAFSRAYTLSLSPQMIYTKSKLLAQLVSSKVYRQLEFQAVGNWWIFDGDDQKAMKRLPNGREDIFQDKTIDNRAKRSLMKFLKFAIDFENQTGVWEAFADEDLAGFLSSQFQLPKRLQIVITALTLSLESPARTPVQWALPMIARHLTSIGVFGPGFGAVIPKWGGSAEIAQVACRASAVGGGTYILGTGLQHTESIDEESEKLTEVTLSNGEVVKARHIVSTSNEAFQSKSRAVSKTIAVVSSALVPLFQNTVEGCPLAAASVVVLPPDTVKFQGGTQCNPVYIMIHSSDTGECPVGQCVLYATTLFSENSKAILDASLSKLLEVTEDGRGNLLYSLYYEQEFSLERNACLTNDTSLFVDLAFNDQILEKVEEHWRDITAKDANSGTFMKFEERDGTINSDEDND